MGVAICPCRRVLCSGCDWFQMDKHGPTPDSNDMAGGGQNPDGPRLE